MTCEECGYRTPEPNRYRRPLSNARLKYAFSRHRCAPRDTKGNIVAATVCVDCGTIRLVHTPRERCKKCLIRHRTIRQAEVDEIAVERLLSGTPVKATRAERQAAVAYLTRHGLSARAIAERTGMSERTVVRLRIRQANEHSLQVAA